MSKTAPPNGPAVRGRVDSAGRLVEADPPLAALHARAGGEERGPLAVPQIASLARLARRLGVVISRPVIAADGDVDLELWLRAQPAGDEVELSITGWTERAPRGPSMGPDAERQADFLRASADWMWETDESLRFTALSPGAAAAVGKSPAALLRKPLTHLFHFIEAEDGTLPILAALSEHRSFDGQAAEVRGGNKHIYLLSGIPLVDGAGNFAGFRGAAASASAATPVATRAPADSAPDSLDVTAFGEQLDRALRAPLDHIISNAETISEQPDGPLRRHYAGYARDIAAAGRHLLELVGDLVDLQAIERPDFAPDAENVDLADIARRAAGLLAVRAADRDVNLDVPAEGESLAGTGEFKRVLQILMNLISNAIRYSPDGGMVWIRTERQGNRACVIVADQGKGIAEADHARIFDKFERVDPDEPGGTGLGLYIARRLARAMGGDISVHSALGQGARFTLTLPSRH
jgi:signal transduction histidine kinase